MDKILSADILRRIFDELEQPWHLRVTRELYRLVSQPSHGLLFRFLEYKPWTHYTLHMRRLFQTDGGVAIQFRISTRTLETFLRMMPSGLLMQPFVSATLIVESFLTKSELHTSRTHLLQLANTVHQLRIELNCSSGWDGYIYPDCAHLVTSIGCAAFSGWNQMPDLSLCVSLEKIGSSAFFNAIDPPNLTNCSRLVEIGNYAFFNITRPPDLTKCPRLKHIYFGAFYNLTEDPDFSKCAADLRLSRGYRKNSVFTLIFN